MTQLLQSSLDEILSANDGGDQDGDQVINYDQLENFDDWAQLFVDLHSEEQTTLWVWADACLEFRKRVGKSFKALSSVIPRTKRTLESYALTAETFPLEKRYQDVGFSVYRICAYSEKPFYWLSQAVEHGWTNTELRQEIAIEEGTFTGPCPNRAVYCKLQMKMVSSQECNKNCLIRENDKIEKIEERKEQRQRVSSIE